MRTTARSFGILYDDIRAGAILLFVSMTVLWSSGAVGREMSLTCIHNIMTSAREGMVLCGERLDPASESAYDKLRAALKTFINDNATSDRRIAPDYDQSIHLIARDAVRKGFCKRQEYQFGKLMLLEFLQPDQESAIRRRLEIPGDPTKGVCF